jgi:hypothetical protein
MKRQELIAFSRDGSRHRLREVLLSLAFSMTWMAILFFYGGRIIDHLGLSRFLVLAAVPVVALVAVAEGRPDV